MKSVAPTIAIARSPRAAIVQGSAVHIRHVEASQDLADPPASPGERGGEHGLVANGHSGDQRRPEIGGPGQREDRQEGDRGRGEDPDGQGEQDRVAREADRPGERFESAVNAGGDRQRHADVMAVLCQSVVLPDLAEPDREQGQDGIEYQAQDRQERPGQGVPVAEEPGGANSITMRIRSARK